MGKCLSGLIGGGCFSGLGYCLWQIMRLAADTSNMIPGYALAGGGLFFGFWCFYAAHNRGDNDDEASANLDIVAVADYRTFHGGDAPEFVCSTDERRRPAPL